MEIVTQHHQRDNLSPTNVSDLYRSMKRTVWLILVVSKKDKQYPIYRGGVCLHRSGIILSVNCIFPEEDFEVYGKGESTITFSRLELLARDSLRNLSLLTVKPVGGDNILEFDFSVFSENEAFIGQNVFSAIHVHNLFYTLAGGHVAYPHVRTYSDVKADVEMRYMKNSSDTPFSSKEHSQDLSLAQIYGFSTSEESICGCPVFETTGRLIGLIGFIGLDFSYAISLTDLREFCMEKRQLGFPQNITISFEGDRMVEVKTQKGVSGKKRKNERAGGSSKQTRSEKFTKKEKTRLEKLLKQKFFKHAHSTLACTFPNGLSPLVEHFKMQKTKEADLPVEYEAFYQDKEPLSQQKHLRRISTCNFTQQNLKSQVALIQDDNGVTYAEDQDVSWEQRDQHDEVRLPAESSLGSNNSIGKPSQELIDLHGLDGLLASFPIETLHVLKGCFNIGEDDEGTVSPKQKGAHLDSEQQLHAKASGAINQDTGKYESENSRQACSIQCQVIPEQKWFLGSTFSSKKGTSDGDSGVDRFKRQFAHLEDNHGKGERSTPLQRQHASLPRERVPALKDETADGNIERQSAAALATSLNSPPKSRLADGSGSTVAEGQNEPSKPNYNARSLLKSASISASKCIGVQKKRDSEHEEAIAEGNDEVDEICQKVAALNC